MSIDSELPKELDKALSSNSLMKASCMLFMEVMLLLNLSVPRPVRETDWRINLRVLGLLQDIFWLDIIEALCH